MLTIHSFLFVNIMHTLFKPPPPYPHPLFVFNCTLHTTFMKQSFKETPKTKISHHHSLKQCENRFVFFLINTIISTEENKRKKNSFCFQFISLFLLLLLQLKIYSSREICIERSCRYQKIFRVFLIYPSVDVLSSPGK